MNVSELSNKAQYKSVSVAFQNVDEREAYLKRIRNELDAFVRRNQNVEELADILLEYANRLKGV